MRMLRFGKTGTSVPAVSFGTWPHGGLTRAGDLDVGWSGHNDDRARAALCRAAERGITHWDTADVYGNGRAERLIGSLWGEVSRDDIFLASKVGWDPGPHDGFYHPDQIRAQAESSLENLRVDCIDLYYLHHCDFGEGDARLDDALSEFHKLRDAGKIRFIGLSDWSSEKVVRLTERVQPDAVQVYRNVVDDSYRASGLKKWVEDHDAGVAFFSPIRHGLLLGKYDAVTSFPEGDHRNRVQDFADVERLRELRQKSDQLRRRFGAEAEPVLHGLLGALLTGTETGCVLLGLRNPDQVNAAVGAGELLGEDDRDWVFELYSR